MSMTAVAGDLSSRLRSLRDRNNWTVADMAERSGIPKRSLDKYMLRSGASLPGLEALCALSRGLGVSLDWLVFGSDNSVETHALMTQRATYDAVFMLLENLIQYQSSSPESVISKDTILNVSPEELAADIGLRVKEAVQSMVESGVTAEELLLWRERNKDRLIEIVTDRVGPLTTGKSSLRKTGNGN